MNSIIEALKCKSDFYCEKGASEDIIINAEKELGLHFADDYKECIKQYGSVSYSGHELTGISSDKELDVVSVTLKNRQKNPNINIPLYVIEEAHIDGIVIWQAATGEIYKTGYKEAPVKICGSLSEYIEIDNM